MSGTNGAFAAGAAGNAYVPSGSAATPVMLGSATYHFLKMPLNFEIWQFVGIAFILFVIARHWGKFVNEL